mgnify:CR=1 FL=1
MRRFVPSTAVLLIYLAFSGPFTFGQAQQPSSPAIDQTHKQAVVDEISTLLNKNYIFPETAKKIEDALRAKLKSGDLDGVSDEVDNCPPLFNPDQVNTRGLSCSGGSNPGASCTVDEDCLEGGTCSVQDLRGDACDSTTSDQDADQIVDVDLTTEDLRKRLEEGKIYPE